MRNKTIDVVKAWGIILVIMGHTYSPFNKWIYSFHMPLFFFVSGFLRYGGKARPWGRFFVGKLRSSLIPYVVLWFVSVVLYGNLSSWLATDPHCLGVMGELMVRQSQSIPGTCIYSYSPITPAVHNI